MGGVWPTFLSIFGPTRCQAVATCAHSRPDQNHHRWIRRYTPTTTRTATRTASIANKGNVTARRPGLGALSQSLLQEAALLQRPTAGTPTLLVRRSGHQCYRAARLA
jgi:hypothetical protein